MRSLGVQFDNAHVLAYNTAGIFHTRTTESQVMGSLSIKGDNAHVLPCNKHIAINGDHQLLET